METSWMLGYTGNQTLFYLFKMLYDPCALKCNVFSNSIEYMKHASND